MDFLKRLLGLSPQSTSPISKPDPSRHDVARIDEGNDDIVKGWRYHATLQLRTPLYVLNQHDRVVPSILSDPPAITSVMWHGTWLPELDDRFAILNQGSTTSSDVGSIPADGGDYLPFLKAVRAITEGALGIEDKEAALREVARDRGPHGAHYSRFITADDLVDRALPRVVHLLPVPSNVRAGLLEAGLDTLAKVGRLSDGELRAVKGLGPKALEAIREVLASPGLDLNAQRYLNPDFGPYVPPS